MARSIQSIRSSSNLIVMDETSFDEQSWYLIGGGGGGQVWKTKHLQWGCNVAIKSFGLDDGLNSEYSKTEAEFMRAAEGPYILRIIGKFKGVIPRIGNICVGLVMEMMERGSLASLQGKLNHLPPWPLVFRLAHQVALGMNYLHCLKPDALIHKDLKPDNILLDSGLNVKIIDFGLTKFVGDPTAIHIKGSGTPPYSPPPEFSQGGATTYAYDVYSYAMLLYSILHTGRSFPVLDDPRGKSMPVFDNSRERPTLEYVKVMKASGLEELVDIMVKCWNPTPAKRPTFKECIAVTERLYEKHKNEICDAVYEVQQELDGVPVVENPSGTNQDTELKELRDKMAEMRVESKKAGVELQLQKGKMSEMMVKIAALEDGVPVVENPSGTNQDTELKELRDQMAEMMVESRKAGAELQLQKGKMAEMRKKMTASELEMMVELPLQKDNMDEMKVELQLQKVNMAKMLVESKKAGKMAEMSKKAGAELQLQKDQMSEMMVKMAALEDGVPVMEKELRDKMADMRVESKKAGAELQLQKDEIAEMSKKAGAELQLQKDEMAEMRVESKKTGAELQLQKGEMAEMRVESRKTGAELQLQKDEMAEMSKKAGAELQLQKDEMAEMRVESKKTGAELQVQKDEMAEMSEKAGAELQLQKDKMAEMSKKAGAELQLQKDKMAEMSKKAGAELQLQKDEMAEMSKNTAAELQLQKDEMAEMRVESRKAGAELQLQKDEMAEMRVESRKAGAELQLQKDKMAEMMVKMAALEVDAELRRIEKYEKDVTLDPKTAHPTLILSKDGKKVSHGDVWKNLPDNTERFSTCVYVLGKEGFSSGRFYYEVQVGGKTGWRLGVVRVSIDRKGDITTSPNNGLWVILLLNGKYLAAADLYDVSFPVKGKLQKVGVFVDYEEGLVSFYDVEARVHLYSYRGCSFTEKLIPFFCPCLNAGGINSAPLIIHTPSKH